MSNGEEIEKFKDWVDVCIDLPIKVIISEHLKSKDESEFDSTIHSIFKREPNHILYSGGLGVSMRNKFFIYS